MSDIIREVDEELRRERIEKLWQRYGVYIVAAAFLIVLAVAGWRAWDWYEIREAAKSGARFEAALQLVNDGKRFEAEAAFNIIMSGDATPISRQVCRSVSVNLFDQRSSQNRSNPFTLKMIALIRGR